jgi:transpeptidase family protein/MecA-like transpeptidase family protein
VNEKPVDRRWRLIHRGVPALVALGLVALILGVVVGSSRSSQAEDAVSAFMGAWERGDTRAMYALLTPSARSRYSASEFERGYDEAAATSTATGVEAGDPAEREGRVIAPVAIRTRVFGTVRGDLSMTVVDGAIAWTPGLVFPGLPDGVPLTRRSRPPARGTILSRDGKVLARGPAAARTSPLGPVSGSIAGSLAPHETERQRDQLYARGFPHNWPVGQTGLEHAFDEELSGRPGGVLMASSEVLARAEPRKAPPLRTTIDTRIQEAAVVALAGRFGGVAALDARTAEVRALAGIAFSAPQPPGSVFKIVTTTAALEANLVKPSTQFPVETAATIDGVPLANANGESCGGSFQGSFAHSCNSVFAPLGVKIGSERLVDAAERYGFNREPSLEGELPSTIPPATDIETPLDIGSTAIGQGKVLTTPLRMASISQTIAAGGVMSDPTLLPRERHARPQRVTSRVVANTIGRFMVDVVDAGTGTAAAIPGVKVAGKTGTAELEDTRGPLADEGQPDDESNTDAWFTAYAPAQRPTIAVAVLLVRAGAGGATAAPAARVVLETGIQQ